MELWAIAYNDRDDTVDDIHTHSICVIFLVSKRAEIIERPHMFNLWT